MTWEFDNADRCRCEGVVTRVITDLKLNIQCQDDETEDVDDQTFLNVVKTMKKDKVKTKKTQAGKEVVFSLGFSFSLRHYFTVMYSAHLGGVN